MKNRYFSFKSELKIIQRKICFYFSIKKLGYFCVFLMFLFVRKLLSLCTHNQICKITLLIGQLTHFLFTLFKTKSYHHIQYAFPSFTDTQITKLHKEYCQHISRFLIECMQLDKALQHWNTYIHISQESIQTLQRLMSYQKGVICITGHFGNWEYLALALARQPYKINAIYRPLNNIFINKYICTLRKLYPVTLINKKKSYNRSITALHNKEILVMLIDQNQARNSIFVNFFTKPAATAKGSAILSYKTHAKILGASIIRQNNIHQVFLEEIHIIHTTSLKRYLQINTQIFTHFIEKIIRKHPPQWLWSHPRWKTQNPTILINKT